MKAVRIEIPGVPVGKARPRFTRSGRVYTAKKTTEYEHRVALGFLHSGEKSFAQNVPLVIDIIAEMPIPKSTPKYKLKQMVEEEIPHIKKPDLDNIVKAVLDGLNGIAFPDDNQICRISAFKKYSENPKTVIVIMEKRYIWREWKARARKSLNGWKKKAVSHRKKP